MNENKGTTVTDNFEATRLCKELDIKVKGNFILNLPGANRETMYECLNFAIGQNLDFAMFYALTAYPETKLWKNPGKYGMRITDYGYTTHQCSDNNNVEMFSMSNEEFKPILIDIRNSWKKFKGTEVPWES